MLFIGECSSKMQLNIYSSNFECRSPGFHGVISNCSRPDLKPEFTELLNTIICDLTSDIIGLDLCSVNL